MSQIDTGILFSISIPTYNRASYLKRCLESLYVLNNADKLPIEVSVYNNNSTDNTEDVVMDYINRGYNIRYSKNPELINGNLNIYQCYQKARGKYIVCLGDDDAFVEGSLQKIVDFLSANEIGVFYMPGEDIKNIMQQKTLPEQLSIKELPTGFDYIHAIHYCVTFISSNIIRNPQINEYALIDQDYLNFYQVPPILKQAFSGYKNYICETITLNAEQFNAKGHDLIEIFLTNLHTVIAITPGLDKSTKEKITKVIDKELLLGFFPFSFYNMRALHSFQKTMDSMPVMRAYFKKNLYYYLFIVPIVRLPLPLALLVKRINGFYGVVRAKIKR
jgi:O-antigen biosynthesis alpha-1,3-abequosyltransferase